jgi:nucleoid-associated protein YgaU
MEVLVSSFARIRSWVFGFAVLFSLALLPGCGGASRVNPDSQDETGSVTDQAKETPSVYVVKHGDTLTKIAARPEIYGDKDLWPLLAASNQDVLIPGKALVPGAKLLIRRDLREADKAMAREQARARAAQAKDKKAAVAKPTVAVKTALPQPAAPKPAATAQPAAPAMVVAAAQPATLTAAVIPTKKGMLLPIILIFLFVLLVALVVLLYVMRRENQG